MAAWRAAGQASSGKVTLSILAAVRDSVRPAVQLRLYPPVFLYRARPHFRNLICNCTMLSSRAGRRLRSGTAIVGTACMAVPALRRA